MSLDCVQQPIGKNCQLSIPVCGNMKDRLFSRGLTYTAALRTQWASEILYKRVDLIK